MDFAKMSVSQLKKLHDDCKYDLMNEQFKYKRKNPVGFSNLYLDTLKHNMITVENELKLRGEDIK
jgi:ribosomal protein L29